MELNISTSEGAKGTVEVSELTFDREFNADLVHQAVTAYLAGARQGTRAQKTRSDVSGGGKKPWNQKGSGRARAGTIRSPIWRGGGRAFAARPQDHSQKLNKKMYRAAMQCILSELARTDRLVIVESFSVEAPKTKLLVEQLAAFDAKHVLIVTEEVNENLYLAARNLHNVEVCDTNAANAVSLVHYEKVIMTVEALKKFEEMLG